MRAMALDIGEVRIGVALSDTTGSLASPLTVLPVQEVLSNAKSFRRILEDWEPDILVIGRPKTMAGEDGPQAQQIADVCQLPLTFQDERLSSQEAKRILHKQGLSEKKMRGKVDAVAASLFLQTWLDRQKNEVNK